MTFLRRKIKNIVIYSELKIHSTKLEHPHNSLHLIWSEQPSNDAEDGRFACAGGTNDAYCFPMAYLKITADQTC
jgi:hypothetical protein